MKVLGTKFNVKAYPNDTRVITTLTSGKIEVNTQSKESKVLQPNEQLSYNIHTSDIHIKKVEPAETNAWLTGQILFINSSFREIKQTLERHFNITIDDRTKIPESKRYTVKFLKNENMEEVLNVLKDVVGFTYQQQGRNIILKKEQ